MRTAVLAVLSLVVSACASAPVPVNQPLKLGGSSTPPAVDLPDSDPVVLAFSGGGARAASFSYGALLGLRETRAADGQRLIDHVALVTAVSGGSITAAWFGQHGPDGLDGFRAAALDKDWTSQLNSNWAPTSWVGLLNGGINGPAKLSGWLDREIYHGARLADLRAGPRILLNATDLYTGATFAFARPWFDAICSNPGEVRVADAVAASMAVPLGFRSVVVASYPDACPVTLPDWTEAASKDSSTAVLRSTARAFEMYRDPARMKYLHLADGGVVDNFGLTALSLLRKTSATPWGPLSREDAVKLHSLTVLVVNAEMSPEGDWPLSASGPGGGEVLGAALDDAINAAKRNAYDAFGLTLADWRRDLVAWRCSLSASEVQALGAPAEGWRCDDVGMRLDMLSFADLSPDLYRELGSAPTRVSLPPALVDDLIKAGRNGVVANGAIKQLMSGAPMN
ncbi:MAG: patatin-like phospholipase family protein [Alphaproteobacteria bacterium]|nr:patatin-like phospholipase family protein [Alphaproteobacteria bacterium]